MATYTNIIPFIKQWEGNYGNNPDDAGGETREGITYTTWQSVFGPTHDRFMAMADADWDTIFKQLFWDRVYGDQINSQAVAEVMVDWAWCSGPGAPAKSVQAQLVQNFGSKIAIDGMIGMQTVNAINAVDGQALAEALVKDHLAFVASIPAQDDPNDVFLKGWQNRINALASQLGLAAS